MKLFAVSSILLLGSGFAYAEDDASAPQPCDRILHSMSRGCNAISKQLLEISSVTDPKAICCTHFRYNVCVQSAKAYGSVARVTKLCPEEHYTSVVDELENNPLLSSVKQSCQDFNSQTCISKGMTNIWDNFKTNVNLDFDKIEKKWDDTTGSISDIAKEVGKQFEAKTENLGDTIKQKAKEFGEHFKNGFGQGTQKLKDMFSRGDSSNIYSMVDADGSSNSPSIFDLVVHSVVPDVEFGNKESAKIQEEPSQPARTNGFMDFFHSVAGTLQAPIKPKESNINPYTLVK